MNYLQPGQLALKTWQEVFKDNSTSAVTFIESMNEKGAPKGMLPLTHHVVEDFHASFVLVDWNNEPVAHAAYKMNKVFDNEPDAPTVAILGALCCTKYSGYKLSQYPLQAALFAAKSSGADWLEANCNKYSYGLFYELGFKPVDIIKDGKTKVAVHCSQLSISEPAKIVTIKLPTFVDGGRYD